MSATPFTRDDVNKPSGVRLFGRDIMSVPCLRTSLLYGITTGVGVLLTSFMLTSRSKLSCHLGVGSFLTVTTVYWVYKRTELYIYKNELSVIRDAIEVKNPQKVVYVDSFEDKFDARPRN